ncbi:MAG TPA: GxxExxY protein [Armatimonadota bacterium]|nr:GxxExxY protein [Armatimonadota bacterium]
MAERIGLVECPEELIGRVLDAATAVHRAFGPGLLESVYELALMMELTEMGIAACRQVEVPVSYGGEPLGVGFRADIIAADSLLLELKAIAEVTAVHQAQVITYLKLLGIRRGYILNFNRPLLRDGIKRISI